MGRHLQRAQVLFDQRRYDLAESELRNALAVNPNGVVEHAMLAICLARLELFEPALEEAREAIRLAPDYDYAYYALSRVFQAQDRWEEAQEAIREALRLNLTSPDRFAELAFICYKRRAYREALQATKDGLALDPGHVICLNYRAMALSSLGRVKEALAVLDQALARNPEHAYTQANRGARLLDRAGVTWSRDPLWTLFGTAASRRALDHFREALRIDPELTWAQLGLERILLARARAVLLAFSIGLLVLVVAMLARWGYFLFAPGSDKLPLGIAIILLPVVLGFSAVHLPPMGYLVLRLTRSGRGILSHDQITASNFVIGAVAASFLAIAVGLIVPASTGVAFTVLWTVFAVLPVLAVFNCPLGRRRRVMIGYCGFLAVLGLVTWGLFLAGLAAPAVPCALLVLLGEASSLVLGAALNEH